MKSIGLFLFLLLVIFPTPGSPLPTPADNAPAIYAGDLPDWYGPVLDVADGDTFYIRWFTEKKMAVRLKGIDTPETKDRRRELQYWGPEAAEYTKSALLGRTVRLDFEGKIVDPFGRLLAYVWYWNGSEWVFFNKELLETGMAFVYPAYEFEYPLDFLRYQQEAVRNRRGMWRDSGKIENDYVKDLDDFLRRSGWFREWMRRRDQGDR